MITVKEIDSNDVKTLECGFSDSPFGRCFIATWHNNVIAFSFVDELKSSEEAADYLNKRWQQTDLYLNNVMAIDIVRASFSSHQPNVSVCLCGTPFQNIVWNALIKIPLGSTVAYSDVAKAVGMPKAVRAVASAIAANEIAVLIPCHRVKRIDGSIGQYRWGVHTKLAILEYENLYLKN